MTTLSDLVGQMKGIWPVNSPFPTVHKSSFMTNP